MIKRNSNGQFIKGTKKPKSMLAKHSIAMMGDNNPSRQPGVGKKISEGKAKAKGWITKQEGYAGWMEKKRELKKKENGGSHTFGDWVNLKAQYNWTCPCCGKSEPDIKLTEDHIIPISKGGSDNIENIQPLCVSCNSKKSTKIIRFNQSMA